MKRFFAFLLVLCLLGFAGACSSDPAGSDGGSVVLSASPAGLEFFADSDVQSLEVKSTASKWMIAAADAWCQTDVSSGSGDRSVRVSVAANTSGAPRSTQLTLSAEGAEPVVVSVVQSDMAAAPCGSRLPIPLLPTTATTSRTTRLSIRVSVPRPTSRR